MMADGVVDGDWLQNLKQSRIGESEGEEGIEDGHRPASEIVEIVVSLRGKRGSSVDAGERIVFFGADLSCEMWECIEARRARTFSVKYIYFSIFTRKTGEYHSMPIDSDFSEYDSLNRKHDII